MTSETVRQAAAMPDLNHREPAYREMFADVQSRLLSLYPAYEWRVCLIGGSGTAAVEAMVSSCVTQGPVLVLTNGYYSERIVDLLSVYGIPFKALSFPWKEALDLDQVAAELKQGYEAVLCVHNETTTGRLNDIHALGELCRRHGAKCLVDAMSSFGVEAIDFGCLDAVASSANKCLHGVPGVSFVLLSPRMVEQVVGSVARTYYLSLKRYLEVDTPLTPPVPAIAALQQALHEMSSVEARRKRYLYLNTWIRRELDERGFEAVIPYDSTSITLTTYRAPNGSARKWIEENRERGFLLYGCKGELAETHFQVANMGELTDEQIRGWLRVVDELQP